MRRIAGAVALAGAIILGPIGAHGAGAIEDVGFTAVAEATVFNMQYGVPGFILTDKYVDGGGPTAQARYESSGGKRANAQMPYLGFVADYPGLINTGSGGQAPSVPHYPGRAIADTSQNSEQVQGSESAPYFLKATAYQTALHSIARLGAPPGSEGASAPSSISTTDVTNEADKVTVSAETSAQSFSLGPLSVADMRSKSVTTFARGATPVTKTELLVKKAVAGPMSFSFGADGLKVAENGVPVPAADGLKQLNSALAPMGLQVNFAGPTKVRGGEASAVFEIIETHPAPGAGQGQGIFRVRFGGVVSAIELGAGEAP